MNISKRTIEAVAKAIRLGVHDSLDDEDLVEAAWSAFADTASINDWDQVDALKEQALP